MYVYLFKLVHVCIDMYLIFFLYFREYLIITQLNLLIFILIIDINRNKFLIKSSDSNCYVDNVINNKVSRFETESRVSTGDNICLARQAHAQQRGP